MLRHSTGYKLAYDGHDTRSLAHYPGHRNLQSTAVHGVGAGSAREVLAGLAPEARAPVPLAATRRCWSVTIKS
jgi:hypothetical protein